MPEGAGPPPPSSGPQDLNLLRTFLAVHRAGSFTAAARLLGLSQPTVTAQIRALERQTGRELFARLSRGVAPAPYADELAARVVGPLDALAELAAGPGPGSGDGPASGEPVHLAGPAELLSLRALPALAPLVDQGVRLRVVTGLTDPLLEGLRVGRHDLVLATTRPRERALSTVPLMDEEFVLVAAPGTAARVGGRQRVSAEGPAALHGLPLVTYAEDLPITRRYWRHVFGRRLTTRAAVTVPDLRGVLAAVVAGAGFAVLPRYLCAPELDTGRLALLHAPEDPPLNTTYLARRPGTAENPDVARVSTRLRQAAGEW
ncbi:MULTISPECIES: LysR family transcriptional regulator [unclassified Streptomyces]|uniref:LysR family transcriptional regulator n=1 Tax=unclassified Streptomyces TaxID=2593676 RepID=UPI002DD97F61|nr:MULTISPECIES: LysR family transcriptional regulator [unclassified Streptomyces]WSA94322.1 LysR family transcriptional regulator [Streptomyces sp. NBC_01795]WSB78740.1 LysR family transcriptional regulator [Streptomyces sp. NBC_01775]WSS13056.1 LysR family transcriptional regulator [Streptomyces sp. NBC_01186]WSS41840.1 LysR family transcriptional regulator [Streptomyces sp. NBC_01187]